MSSGIPIDVTIIEELQEKLDEWLPIRMQTIVELCDLAKQLGSLSKLANGAKFLGTSASLLGGIGSVLFAPFTGGLSLAGSALFLTSGTATTAATAIVQQMIERGVMEKAKDAIDKDRKMTEKLTPSLLKFVEALDIAKEISNTIKNKALKAVEVCGAVAGAATVVQVVLPSAVAVVELSRKTSKFCAKIATSAAVAGAAFTLVKIPFDILQLNQTANDIANGSPNENAKQIMNKLNELQEEYNTLKTLLEDIKK